MKKVCALMAIVIMTAGFCLAQVPASNHVVLIVEESHSYSSVIGSTAMPYLNSLASKYGLATQYYANTHPSIGDYFELTTGQVLTNDATKTPANFPISSDNMVRQLMIEGKTWKSYAEGLPYAGYTGGDTGSYVVRHNPFAYLTDVQNSSTQKLNLVPFSQFATDLANNQLPNFSYILPNLNDDTQNGTLQQADGWLKQNIAPLLASAAFQQDGLLIITFATSATTDTTDGGGQVATIVIGPKVKAGSKSTTFYQHQSLLKTILTALGASEFPGAAASAPAMTDLFASSITGQTTASSGVTITSPTNGATVPSPVKFVASATSSNSAYPITAMRIYVDNASVYTVYSGSINTSLTLPSGGHSVTVVAWDSAGHTYTKSLSINVGSTTSAGVTISSPANGAIVASPVNFVAAASSSDSTYPITAMRLYVDNTSKYTVNAANLNTSLALPAGGHSVTVVAWDSAGHTYTKSLNINVGSTTAAGVTISSPANGATVASPVNFVAAGTSSNSTYPITAMRLYVDNTSKYTVNAANFNTSLALPAGGHSVTVVAWDSAGQAYTNSISINVTTTLSGAVTITSPVNGATVSSPVQFVASSQANSGTTITAMQIYVDGVSAYSVNAAAVNTSLALNGGVHNIVVEAWDNLGTVYKSGETITVSTPVGTLAVSPTTLSFGSVNVGSTASQTVSLTAATAPVTISAANLSGAGFGLRGLTLPTTIAAGQTVSFSVYFAPTVAGSANGTLSLSSNASSSSATIALSGTGASTTATAHSATLTWAASTSTDVVGYYVYRGTQSGGPYTKLTSTAITGTTYTDSSVSAGTTYYYVVTAADSSGVESGYSNSASAVIPTP